MIKILGVAFLISFISGCGGIENQTSEELVEGSTSGTFLYDNTCATCHGVLSKSDILAYTVERIQSNIDSNAGGMGFLSYLSAEQIQEIVNTLTEVWGPPSSGEDSDEGGGEVVTGKSLYETHCPACHTNRPKFSASPTRIRNAINFVVPRMSGLSFLTDQELQLISDYTKEVCTPALGCDNFLP